jgi:hypothetical protein
LTPNVIAQSSAKVAMATRFLALVGSLSLEEPKLWLPNQLVHDPESWNVPHLLLLKREYEVLVKDHGCQVQEMYTVQDHPPRTYVSTVLNSLEGRSSQFRHETLCLMRSVRCFKYLCLMRSARCLKHHHEEWVSKGSLSHFHASIRDPPGDCAQH